MSGEEGVTTSWVTVDRFCREQAQVDADIRAELERNGRPLRWTAEPLSDDGKFEKCCGSR